MKLLEPGRIGNVEVKNRIIMPAMQLVLGLINRRARAYYLERARGGAGAVPRERCSEAKRVEPMRSYPEERKRWCTTSIAWRTPCAP